MHIIFIVIKLKLTNSDISYVVRYVRNTDLSNYKILLNCNIFNSVADRKTIINTNNCNLFKQKTFFTSNPKYEIS